LIKKIVCFAGKGGVGKSTSVLLFLKYVIAKYPELKKIIIDADPDANILDMLGKSLSYFETIGGQVGELQKRLQRDAVPPNVSEKTLIEDITFKSIKKLDDFDLIIQGRKEGEGCYCSVNNILKNLINTLEDIYELVIIDSPAGLEFFARKTSKNIDDLILVVDTSKMSFHTIQRLIEIREELSLEFNNVWVLVNKFSMDDKQPFLQRVEEYSDGKAELLGFLSHDSEIQKYNLTNSSLLNLPEDNPVYQEACKVYSKLFDLA
jgi:CO dehydrogenase maturation factor